MKLLNFSSMTLTAVHAALKAGEVLKSGFGTTYEIMPKPGRQNFVTEYDKASEACIISFIQKQFPSHNFLAEESGFTNTSNEENILWIIDPLDGTTNFAHHIPLFTISIAAYHQENGVCGVIFQPLTQELFIAEKGKGAYLYTPRSNGPLFEGDSGASSRNRADGVPPPLEQAAHVTEGCINGSRLHVSQTDHLEEAILIASFPYDANSIPIFNLEGLVKIIRQGATLRNLGSAALALAYVAAGKVDAFWMYNLYPWDLAAGQLLIEEAGGRVNRYETSPTSFRSPANILASNQALHSPLQKFLFP